MITSKTIQTPKGAVEYLEGGSGPDLVFLHGAGGITADSPFLAALAAKYHLYAPFLPGYGESEDNPDIRDMLDVTLHTYDVLAALGLEWTWRRTGWAFAALLAVAMATQAGLMVRLHPQEYAYYNQLVGGVRGAELKWEGDYWSNGMGQAARLLAEALRDERPARPYKVGVCANDNNTLSAMYVLPPNFIFIDRWEDADFVIANDDCWRDQPGRMIARFERLGVTYAAAFDRRALPAGN